MFSICPQCGYSTLTLTFYDCPDPDWCCSCWQLVESKLVRMAANVISFCEENSAMFWVVSVCPMTVMNVTPIPNEDLLYRMYLSCVTDKLRQGCYSCCWSVHFMQLNQTVHLLHFTTVMNCNSTAMSPRLVYLTNTSLEDTYHVLDNNAIAQMATCQFLTDCQ
jgi:hypothetical protein